MSDRSVSLPPGVDRPIRLLVVDDETAALSVIPEALRDGLEDMGWNQLTIDVAESGEQALEVAGDGPLDLLVADVVMPGIDGIETYVQLKDRFPHLSCVVMTAHAPQHITPIRALRSGAADYVPKPVDPDYLVTTCHRQLVLGHLRREVEDQQRLLEAIISSVDTGVLAVRGEDVLCMNEAAESLLGTGDAPWERLGPLSTGPDQGPQSKELIVESPEGGQRVVHVVSSPMVDPNGHHNGDVWVFRDVTHLVETKQSESFKQMAAIAAHEMKNSVTGLRLITQHLVAQLDAGQLEVESSRRMATLILDSVDRLDRFARSFLGFSRIPEPAPTTVDPNTLIHEALSVYNREKGLPEWVNIETDLAAELPAVHADRDLLFQVFQNLILNAVEAMEEQGQGMIMLTSRLSEQADEYVELIVKDSGPGIPAEMQSQIFEPNCTTREAGTGLGLVIVRQIVRKHGGQVSVRSAPPDGAAFSVFLPVAAVDESLRPQHDKEGK